MGEGIGTLRARPLVFVDDLSAPRLRDDDHHHLKRVLRVRPGEPITLGDGHGRFVVARFAPDLEPLGDIETVKAPVRLTIGFTPVKAEKPEAIVQRLTELGIDEIVPVFTERSVVSWPSERAARNVERMKKVARESCRQSKRLWFPVIGRPQSVKDFIGAYPGAVMADPGGGPPSADHQTIVIGPEGGFHPSEVELAPLLALPGGILRAATATTTAAVLMSAFRSGLVN